VPCISRLNLQWDQISIILPGNSMTTQILKLWDYIIYLQIIAHFFLDRYTAVLQTRCDHSD